MASIVERNGRFLVRVRRHGFSTVTKTFTRKADGLAWAKRVEVDMEAGRWMERQVEQPTLREAVQEYRRVVAPRLKGAATYKYRFDEFEALPFAIKRIDEVRASDFALWRDKQLTSVKPGTIIRKLAMLSSIFNWAQRERGWLVVNPVSSVSKPRSNDGRARTLTDSEVEWLLKAASTSKATWLRPALVVLMRSAMRRSELCSLRRQDVDFDAATAHLVDTKNGESRDVPLCPESQIALRALGEAALLRGEDRLIPLGPPESLSIRFKVTVKRAQALYLSNCKQDSLEPVDGFLEDLRLHDLRHHAVTSWARSGALSVAELMSISGHKTTRMLVRYTHLRAAEVASKLAALTRPSNQIQALMPPV